MINLIWVEHIDILQDTNCIDIDINLIVLLTLNLQQIDIMLYTVDSLSKIVIEHPLSQS